MSIFDSIWKRLRSSKQYREEFVAAHAKQAIPHQARALMKERGWKQEDLGKHAGLSQGTVSRAVDPSYGNLTLNTIIRLAAGFDVAFIGRFVPFSELAKWTADLPQEKWHIPTFEEEDAVRTKQALGSPDDLVEIWSIPLKEVPLSEIGHDTAEYFSMDVKPVRSTDASGFIGKLDEQPRIPTARPPLRGSTSDKQQEAA